jgi:hypothetical protein
MTSEENNTPTLYHGTPINDIEGLAKIPITDADLSPATEAFDPNVLGDVDPVTGVYTYRGINNSGITRSFDPDNEKIQMVLITQIPAAPMEGNVLSSDFLTTLQDLEKLLKTVKETLPEYMEVIYKDKTYVISKDNPYIIVEKTDAEKEATQEQAIKVAEESFTPPAPAPTPEPPSTLVEPSDQQMEMNQPPPPILESQEVLAPDNGPQPTQEATQESLTQPLEDETLPLPLNQSQETTM